jgi:hypothetical protein
VYLLNAARMMHGEMIYRDFFQFTPPGTEAVYAMLFRVFGVRAWIPQATLVVLGTGLAGLTASISGRIMQGPSIFLPGLLFVDVPFRNWLDGSHHWFSTLVVLSALRVVIERRDPRRLALAGLLCGLGSCFTQLIGLTAVLGIGMFLIWEWGRTRAGSLVKNEGWLVGPFLVAIVAANAYVAVKAGLARFLFCTIVFGAKYYPALWFNTWRVYMSGLPALNSWTDLPHWAEFLFIIALLPAVYAVFWVRYWREAATSRAERWQSLVLLNLTGVFLLAGVAPAPSYFRLCSVCLPALIILVWLANQPGVLERALRVLLWTVALALAITAPLGRQRQWRAYLDLPTGRTAFLNRAVYEEYLWVSERIWPPDFFFGDEGICFAFGLRNPTPVDFLTATDYTRPEQVADVIRGLEQKRVSYVILWNFTDLASWDFALGDATHKQPGNHLGPLIAYLESQYSVVKTFTTGDVVWKRNPQPAGKS